VSLTRFGRVIKPRASLVRPLFLFFYSVAVVTLWKRWDRSSTVSISTSSLAFRGPGGEDCSMPTVQSDLKNDRRKQTRHRLKRSSRTDAVPPPDPTSTSVL
jgi:hypothetical protein